MTTISGFADGILDGTIPKDEQGKYLATISSETKRLNRLVRGMLDISQYEGAAAAKARRSNFNLSELIVQTMLSFEARANEKNLDVDLQLPEEGIFVFADKDAITQVVYNLFDNALKFSLTGSMLGVRLWKQNGLAYVAIKNIGATIPEDELPFIFDRFHKTDKSRSLDKDGVGLGLYIVKTILNNHDQDIAVASRNGATEFTFSLALSK